MAKNNAQRRNTIHPSGMPSNVGELLDKQKLHHPKKPGKNVQGSPRQFEIREKKFDSNRPEVGKKRTG